MTFHHALRSVLQLGKLGQKLKTAPFEARKKSSSPPINPSTRLHRQKKNDDFNPTIQPINLLQHNKSSKFLSNSQLYEVGDIQCNLFSKNMDSTAWVQRMFDRRPKSRIQIPFIPLKRLILLTAIWESCVGLQNANSG